MVSKAFEDFIERTVADEAFAERLKTDFEGALAEYDVTDEEKQALVSRDPGQLQALGLDERISKASRLVPI